MNTSSTINFKELVRLNNMDFSMNIQNKLVEKLHSNFQEEEQRWYAANLYIYMKFHPTEDFPINLDDIYSMIGFSNKANAKKTLVNNFILNSDFKIIQEGIEVKAAHPVAEAGIYQAKRNLGGSGQNKETILLNTETFKNLCMIVRTDMGKKIRSYYVKLETITNSMIKETINEMKEIQLIKNKEIEKKNHEIQQLSSKIGDLEVKEINHIYIGWNPKIAGIHKIGISSDVMSREESHKSSNPDFVYLYTYETPNAKIIEDGVKFLLKNFKLKKPEWFTISFEKLKSVLDFCVMMYETYEVNDSVDKLCHFIERYRANRLVNTCKSRVLVEDSLYKEYLSDNIVLDEKFNITVGMLRDDFYNWYLLKFNGEDRHDIKTPAGHWSTEFTKEILHKVETFTARKAKHVNIRDRMRGLNLMKHSGFVGVTVKNIMKNPGQIYPQEVYIDYIDTKLTILKDEPRYKISRMELLDDFHKWILDSKKHKYNRNMFAEVKFTQEFLTEFIDSLQQLTGKKYYKNLVKKTHRGCFLSMNHVDIDCMMHMSPTVAVLIKSGINTDA